MESYADWLALASTAAVNSIRARTITALTDSLNKAPDSGERLAAFEYYWQNEGAKVRSVEDTTIRSPSAFVATSSLSSVVAALPEIDSDMAVSAYKEQATNLNTEAVEDDVRFDNERETS